MANMQNYGVCSDISNVQRISTIRFWTKIK